MAETFTFQLLYEQREKSPPCNKILRTGGMIRGGSCWLCVYRRCRNCCWLPRASCGVCVFLFFSFILKESEWKIYIKGNVLPILCNVKFDASCVQRKKNSRGGGSSFYISRDTTSDILIVFTSSPTKIHHCWCVSTQPEGWPPFFYFGKIFVLNSFHLTNNFHNLHQEKINSLTDCL